MNPLKDKRFAEKNNPSDTPEAAIYDALRSRAKNEEIPCAVAFEAVKDLNVTPADVGKTMDLANLRLVKCQLGLFGYTPEKKIVSARMPENPDLSEAIRAALAEQRLPCASAWDIADRFGIRKMVVSAACEALGIKIKPCQLGAF